MRTIVIADDHAIVRKGLKALLGSEPNYTVLGEVEDGLSAIELTERLKPDVLIVDLMMPGVNGLEVVRQIHERCPHTRIVVLSMHSNEPYVLEALRTGASAYVLKATSTESLLDALSEVLAGRRYLSPPLSERAIEVYLHRATGTAHDLERYDLLTTREREVLQLLAQGRTYAEIAECLSISPRTAETHRTNLMRKLSLHSQTELVRYAMQRGLISD